MCGIAGYLQIAAPQVGTLQAMTESLRHRGPDSSSFYSDQGLGIGVCRLAIGGTPDGDQPFFDRTGGAVLVYDGEIYNGDCLREELEARGHRFRTASTGELIYRLWHEHGIEAFERLDGMYAVALWLPRSRSLVLARDRVGQKPLHYASLDGGGIAFASEIRALLRHPGVDPQPDRQAAWDMPTLLWVPEPATIHRFIYALPRGQILTTDGCCHVLANVPERVAEQHDTQNPHRLVADIRRRVEQAVEDRLPQEARAGCFLSGGLDSSIVATIAARRLPSLETFCIGFSRDTDSRYGVADESPTAARLARQLGTRHHTIQLTAERARSALEFLFQHSDEPFAVSSGLGLMEVGRRARRLGIGVLLSGDGADELFGGSPSYLTAEGAMANTCGSPPASESRTPAGALAWLERMRRLDSGTAAQRVPVLGYHAAEQHKALLFEPDFTEGLSTSLRWFGAGDGRAWPPQRYLDHDREVFLPNETLRKLDRMTMACSVVGRAPFVASPLLDLSSVLRIEVLLGPGGGKRILRWAFSDLLPDEVLLRPKQGFAVPVDRWLAGPWSDLLERGLGPDSALRRNRWIRRDALERARAMLADPERSLGHTLLSFIALSFWLERRESLTG